MSILTPEFAQQFIQKTVKNLPYNVNIMNHEGIIIASKDSSRIGDFHEVAHGLLSGKLDSGIVTQKDHYIGTKPGINMFIDYKEKHIGVICVTGDPENVQSFAGFVKASMETMLAYEIKMAQNQRAMGSAEKFLHYVLFEEDYNFEEATRLYDRYDIECTKVITIIIIRCSMRVDRDIVLRTLAAGNEDYRKGIFIKGRNDDIIILKNLDDDVNRGISEYKDQIFKYIWDLEETLPIDLGENDLKYYVGSLQTQIDKFRTAYHHAQQISLNPRMGLNRKVTFFLDHIQDYIRNSVTLKLYNDIFSSFHALFQGDEKAVMVETIKALHANNYNLVNTSKDLHVHRNTITFRLNKLKSTLNIDPLVIGSDRELLNELAHYLDKY
ncbi:MAG: sugar diacid recognition domain-containing protein [Spirochaetales bacterium]|nr:sugar diacid recognition domain-containing protein [Spirochaetales bacterium]